MTRLADQLRAAFLSASGHADGWDAVADKAEELIQAARDLGGSYEGIVELINDLPQTWVPALTIKMVEAGYAKNVWKAGGCSAVVANTERRLGMQAIP